MRVQCKSNISTALPEFDRLWDYDHPAETEAKFREVLERAEISGGNENYCAELLTQIARTQGLQRRFEDGHRTLDRVEAVMGETPPRVKVRCLLERGRLFNSAGEVFKAKPIFRAAFDAAEAAGEAGLAIDAAHMLGICEGPEEAIQWNLRALAAAERSHDPQARRWMGSLLNNLGWTYHDQKNFPKAMELFERALAFRTEQGKAKEIRIAKWAVARTLRSLGRVGEALAMQEDLRNQWEADRGEDGFVFEELGECLLELGRDGANRWFAEAYRVLSADKWLVAHEPKRLERLKQLGELRT